STPTSNARIPRKFRGRFAIFRIYKWLKSFLQILARPEEERLHRLDGHREGAGHLLVARLVEPVHDERHALRLRKVGERPLDLAGRLLARQRRVRLLGAGVGERRRALDLARERGRARALARPRLAHDQVRRDPEEPRLEARRRPVGLARAPDAYEG